ncbi:MAG: AbrB/MazE/SpoVT family DNA-binding domain-containing protein [Staphylothermus sp.]|nr:AbrB/MazE/SpoVT family DNA-binding domain-containing protein [Staphylothermus sp.]
MEKFRVKVHKKGLIVIPADVRRRFGISEGSYIELIVDNDGIRIIVPKSLREAFGVDGEKAIEVARMISSSRKFEVEKEIRS